MAVWTGLLLVSGIAQSQDAFLTDFKAKWKNAAEYTLEFAQAMPEDYFNYSPMAEEMTFREQLKHIAGNMVWLSSSYLDGSKTHIDPSQSGNSKKEIIEMLEKAFAYATQTVNALKPHDLNTNVEFIAGTMTKRRILLLMTDHVTHHRGQLVVYLRMKNVKPPKYRGW
jgi:uncharacterized damage-inducible protein DinB